MERGGLGGNPANSAEPVWRSVFVVEGKRVMITLGGDSGRTRLMTIGQIVGHVPNQSPMAMGTDARSLGTRWARAKQVPIRSPISVSSRSQGGHRVTTRALFSCTYRRFASLITQRSLVQIQPPQPIKFILINNLQNGQLYSPSCRVQLGSKIPFNLPVQLSVTALRRWFRLLFCRRHQPCACSESWWFQSAPARAGVAWT